MKVDEIIKLYNDGHSITWISKHINRAYNYVHKRLVDNGVKIRSLKEARENKRLPVMDHVDDIRSDFLSGTSITNLCKKYKSSFYIMKNIISDDSKCNDLLTKKSESSLPDEIIDLYQSGVAIKSLSGRYKYSERKIRQFLLDNGINIRNRSDAAKISDRPKLTEKHKAKISVARIKYLKENPDKVPYLLNHSSRESYPEKRFRHILESIGLVGWIQHYQHSIYQYDFAFPEIKLDVEIDGDSHKLQSVIEKDKNRDRFSNDNGWAVLRFTASELSKNASVCIDKLLDTIFSLNPEYDPYDMDKWNTLKTKLFKSSKTLRVCPTCSTEFYPKRKEQKYCSRKCVKDRPRKSIIKSKVKSPRPSLEQLQSDLKDSSFVATGKKYGVSDNAVRKWLKNYGVDPKSINKKR